MTHCGVCYWDGRAISSFPASADVCSWDGRLDNKRDLTSWLGLQETTPESELALTAFQAAGAAGLGKLVGDFSLSIWSARKRTLWLASDYAGVRPLYYSPSADGVIWSSSLTDLVQRKGASKLSEEYIAGFLAHGAAPPFTPYDGIFAVPAGSLVKLSAAGQETVGIWQPPLEETLRYSNDTEYQEQFRALFAEGVSARLAGATNAWIELSGGLDSSSVACAAVRLVRPSPTRGLATLTYQESNSIDERFYRAVEDAIGLPSVHLDLDQLPIVSASEPGIGAPAWWQMRFREVGERMTAAGASVLLTGQMGDLVTGNWLDDSAQVGNAIRKLHLSAAVREAFAWSQSLRKPIYPILWGGLRTALGSWDASMGLHSSSEARSRRQIGDSLAPRLQEQAFEIERQRVRRSGVRHALPSRRKHVWALLQVLENRILQCPEALQPAVWAHPYAHRPLVEFMLSIPARMVCAPGQPRRLMRAALAGVVPEAVLQRRSKASYNLAFLNALKPLARQLLDGAGKLLVCDYGYVDASRLETRLHRMLNGLDCNSSQLRHIILLELWLRARARNTGRALDQIPITILSK